MEYHDDDSEKKIYYFILLKITIFLFLSRKINTNRRACVIL